MCIIFFNYDIYYNLKDNVPTTKRSHRLLDTKFYSISFCGHCGGIIWVTKTHLKCGNWYVINKNK